MRRFDDKRGIARHHFFRGAMRNARFSPVEKESRALFIPHGKQAFAKVDPGANGTEVRAREARGGKKSSAVGQEQIRFSQKIVFSLARCRRHHGTCGENGTRPLFLRRLPKQVGGARHVHACKGKSADLAECKRFPLVQAPMRRLFFVILHNLYPSKRKRIDFCLFMWYTI